MSLIPPVSFGVDYSETPDESSYPDSRITIQPDNKKIFLGSDVISSDVSSKLQMPFIVGDTYSKGPSGLITYPAIAIGDYLTGTNLTDDNSSTLNTIILGSRVNGSYSGSISIGDGIMNYGSAATVIGNSAAARSNNTVAIGSSSYIEESGSGGSIVIGASSKNYYSSGNIKYYNTTPSTVVGHQACTYQTDVSSVVLGAFPKNYYEDPDSFEDVRFVVGDGLSNSSRHNLLECTTNTIRLYDGDDNCFDVAQEIENSYATWEVID